MTNSEENHWTNILGAHPEDVNERIKKLTNVLSTLTKNELLLLVKKDTRTREDKMPLGSLINYFRNNSTLVLLISRLKMFSEKQRQSAIVEIAEHNLTDSKLNKCLKKEVKGRHDPYRYNRMALLIQIYHKDIQLLLEVRLLSIAVRRSFSEVGTIEYDDFLNLIANKTEIAFC